jgi:L-fuconolactonase
MVPEPEVVDAHTHVVSHDVERYPITPGVPDEQDWHRTHAVDTGELLALAHECGVSGSVLVQAISAHGFDNRYVLDSAQAHPARTVAVGSVQPGAPDAVERLRRDVLEHGMHGVRVFSIDGPGAPIDTPGVRAVVAAACELDVPVLLLGIEHQIPSVATLAAAFPAARLVLDHCGFADLGGGPAFPHAVPLLALAPYENLRLKVSSINLLATPHPESLWSLLVERFGARRLLWGTDYPHTNQRDYASLVALGRRSAASLAAADRSLVLAGTALALWPQLTSPRR